MRESCALTGSNARQQIITCETEFGFRPKDALEHSAILNTALADFSRKGFIDGLPLRMPAVTGRRGMANAAASSYVSGIIRESLAALPAQLPVADTLRHWFVSHSTAVRFLRQAAEADTSTASSAST
ncbi:MAG: hypothetical protein ACI9XK_003690 [Granulosicoccus sp.]|jgi:hypothetical protein